MMEKLATQVILVFNSIRSKFYIKQILKSDNLSHETCDENTADCFEITSILFHFRIFANSSVTLCWC